MGAGTAAEPAEPSTTDGTNAQPMDGELLERVLERGNLQRALKQVRRNKGAPGIDGMSVDELPKHLVHHWEGIKAGRSGVANIELKPTLEAICKQHGVLLNSQAEIGQRINQISNGIAGCLWGLIFLGFVVAAFGVVNTLSMNVLEQTRELGLLRIVAMTRVQVRRTIITQALIIGMVGLVPGVFFGLGIAYIINLAMEPSYGRPIEFTLHPVLMFVALVGSMLITVIAAAIPAHRAAGVDLAQALHYE